MIYTIYDEVYILDDNLCERILPKTKTNKDTDFKNYIFKLCVEITNDTRRKEEKNSWFWSYLEYFNKPKPKGKYYNFNLFCYNLLRENNKK